MAQHGFTSSPRSEAAASHGQPSTPKTQNKLIIGGERRETTSKDYANNLGHVTLEVPNVCSLGVEMFQVAENGVVVIAFTERDPKGNFIPAHTPRRSIKLAHRPIEGDTSSCTGKTSVIKPAQPPKPGVFASGEAKRAHTAAVEARDSEVGRQVLALEQFTDSNKDTMLPQLRDALDLPDAHKAIVDEMITTVTKGGIVWEDPHVMSAK